MGPVCPLGAKRVHIGSHRRLKYQKISTSRAQLSPSMAPHDSNRAKLGPERGTKQPIPPTRPTRLIRPRTFWGSTYKNAPFGFCGCSHKVDNKTEN